MLIKLNKSSYLQSSDEVKKTVYINIVTWFHLRRYDVSLKKIMISISLTPLQQNENRGILKTEKNIDTQIFVLKGEHSFLRPSRNKWTISDPLLRSIVLIFLFEAPTGFCTNLIITPNHSLVCVYFHRKKN